MFGWTLIKDSELRLMKCFADMELKQTVSRALAAEAYAKKCEALLDHERERIDNERERADRIADSLFVSSGLPPASSTGVAEAKAIEAESKIVRADAMKEIADIFAESWDDVTMEEALQEDVQPAT
jgi:hypothetical protein